MQKMFGFLALFLLLGQFSFAQENKNFVKSFDPAGSESVVFKLPHHSIAQKPHDGGALIIELTVEANVPERIMEGLIKAGRYQLEGTKQDGAFVIDAPGLGKTATIGGKPLEEKITISVKTPGAFAINGNTLSKDVGAVAARKIKGNEKALAKFKAINQEIKVSQVNFISTYKGDDVQAKPGVGAGPEKAQYGEVLLDGEPLKME
jgi:hypothetical protein